MDAHESSWGVHWILRVAVAACFVGHGAFGVITKAVWVPYFGVWGISEPWAWRLMPVVGIVDISIGLLTLFLPLRAVLLWTVFWGAQTAALRPLTGEPIWNSSSAPVISALLWPSCVRRSGRGRSGNGSHRCSRWRSARSARARSHGFSGSPSPRCSSATAVSERSCTRASGRLTSPRWAWRGERERLASRSGNSSSGAAATGLSWRCSGSARRRSCWGRASACR